MFAVCGTATNSTTGSAAANPPATAEELPVVSPTGIDVEIHVARITQARRHDFVRDLQQRVLTNGRAVRAEVAEGIPGGPALT